MKDAQDEVNEAVLRMLSAITDKLEELEHRMDAVIPHDYPMAAWEMRIGWLDDPAGIE